MPLPEHKTKIVCTIGPASRSRPVLEHMIRSGMGVARLNFAHGDLASHEEVIEAVRAASGTVGRRVAILADLPGPKMRIGPLAGEPVELRRGAAFTLTTEEVVGDASRASVSFGGLPRAVHPQDTIFLNDGFIQLRVEGVEGAEVHCRVLVGGKLLSHKGLNLPGIDLGVSAVTEHDRQCLAFALEHGADAVSVSFVQSAEDIHDLRRAAARSGRQPFVIAKIERAAALEHIDAIMEAADGIMVARGDLGVEIPIEEIAQAQKGLIHRANLLGKPAITATQMLESMVEHWRPTRAEVTDVANAILDGTDCVMLSEESAIGAYPVEAVATLARIARVTEAGRRSQPVGEALGGAAGRGEISVEDLIALSVKEAVERLAPAAVITPTATGRTARMVSRFRLPVWTVAVSASEQTCQALQLSSGVFPVHEPDRPASWESYARQWLAGRRWPGKVAVLTHGPPRTRPGGTNRMEVIDLGGPPPEGATD